MIHELLLALSGIPGDLFVEDESGFRVVSTFPFLHTGEISSLNRLARLGCDYKRFKSFIQSHRSIRSSSESGLYVVALACSLETVLEPYRALVLDVEKETSVQGQLLTISYVQNKFEKYYLLFPVLREFLTQVSEHKVHGCQILGLLHHYCNSGIILVNQSFQTLLMDCHAVLYKQLSAWFLHGTVLDFNREFFICQQTETVTETGAVATDEEPGKEERLQQRFSIVHELIPSYIPHRIAEKILFIGEAVHMLTHKTDRQQTMDSFLKNEEGNFLSKFASLREEKEFNLMMFERVVDDIKVFIGERLWTFAVKESHLLLHLKLMKDFFLLGRGELFQTFIEMGNDLMKIPPSKTTENDINLLFKQAAHKVFSDDDEGFRNYSLVIEDTGRPVTSPSWDLLGMECTVSWPLHILFTPSALKKYGSLFKFLLRVRRVQMSLQRAWAQQMSLKCAERVDARLGGLWNLRNRMAFLIDNLQYYLQVNVLESQYSSLLSKIEDTKDFEVVCLAHDAYLSAIQEHAFLLMRPIARSLNEILDLSLQLCTLLSYGLQLTERDLAQAGKIGKAFERQSSLLFKILCSVQTRQSSSHLAQFLLKIDYNFFFSGQLSGR
ncbi:gamma-tubulin complex component 4-like [Oscarella lobularis]|uniref:gamma-tubulin complex component 4-like n=1 Tax=Oscarella lobularis TaxID=121494 RepID=UPI0033133AC7